MDIQGRIQSLRLGHTLSAVYHTQGIMVEPSVFTRYSQGNQQEVKNDLYRTMYDGSYSKTMFRAGSVSVSVFRVGV